MSKLIQRPTYKKPIEQTYRVKRQGAVMKDCIQDRLYEIRDEIRIMFLSDIKAKEMAKKAIMSGRAFDYRVTGDIKHQAAKGGYDTILDNARREFINHDWSPIYKALAGQADATITELLVKTGIELAKEGLI